MSVYLRQNKPARSQFRSPRRAKPTGLVVVHTAENVMDTVGPDTGAESVAAFIRGRRDAGSYHDIVDSDSSIQLVRYEDEAYQDGTGSNPYALSLSFALKAADWPRLSAKKTDAFLTQGARALARQQAWLLANRYPVTPLRRVSKADSSRGAAGFIAHGERDPGRRTDPGRAFPWSRFFSIAADLATPTPQEGDMKPYICEFAGSQWVVSPDLSHRKGIAEEGDLHVLLATGQYIAVDLSDATLAAIPEVKA